MDQDLSSVHDAMQFAQMRKRERNIREEENPMVMVSARVESQLVKTTREICDRHGVTISDFIRSSMHLLVTDYVGPAQD